MPGGNSGLPSVAIDPEVMLEATESVIRNEQLGGTIPSSRRSGHYEPIRARLQASGGSPMRRSSVEEVYLEHHLTSGDQWRMDAKRKKLIRVHGDPRWQLFHPADGECPLQLRHLTSHRRTIQIDEDGQRTVRRGDWRKKISSLEECGLSHMWTELWSHCPQKNPTPWRNNFKKAVR